jgi:predicted peptidase
MHIPRPILSALLSILILPAGMPAQPMSEGVESAEVFKRTITVEQELAYLLYRPPGYDPNRAEGWPLILFLHGAGERGTDLSRVKIHGPVKIAEQDPNWPFVIVSPQCPEGKVWDNASLLGLLDAVVAAYNIDTNRIYLTGLSMGGYGTWSLGLAHPQRFAAIAPICGGGERIGVVLAARRHQEALRQLPVWAFHGAKDQVVALEESERMVEALKRLGCNDVRLTIYPEAGHDAWTETYNNPELFQWFLRQRGSR